MHKFTYAISVGDFVQGLKENGDIFVLGTRHDDEFGTKLDDLSIHIMGKTRSGMIERIKEHSEPELVEKVNTLSFYQTQVDNYEKYVNPDRFNKEEVKSKEIKDRDGLMPTM